ncbi:MAG: hypothetical protein AUH99_05120 [Candidatus Rokubacteria bacterium 13_2_20CM_2_70_11]|nr:MAG: hypothetical protein AUH99_05120 [Candidatus Rokubacteria bacterium 13_2_20CM_2_70_11]
MSTRALTYTLTHRRGSRAFFLARSTQHVDGSRDAASGRLQARGGAVREIARAALALAAVIGWGVVALLLAG